MNNIIERTVAFVQDRLKFAEAGHDWSHIQRVWNNTKLILEDEEADVMVCELAALLHDIADSKFHDGDETIGPRVAGEFLASLEISPEVIDHVKKIIFNMSFKASLGEVSFHSKEMEIVQDADRPDAIGAIGIARAFSFGGNKAVRCIILTFLFRNIRIRKRTNIRKLLQSITSTKSYYC